MLVSDDVVINVDGGALGDPAGFMAEHCGDRDLFDARRLLGLLKVARS